MNRIELVALASEGSNDSADHQENDAAMLAVRGKPSRERASSAQTANASMLGGQGLSACGRFC